jgi:hypothetical protein
MDYRFLPCFCASAEPAIDFPVLELPDPLSALLAFVATLDDVVLP